MDIEMRSHLEFETDELMRTGLARSEAERQAALAFGGVQQAKEEVLESGTFWWLDNLRRDVRIATRTLLRHPAFAITATLALAFAIAVNTTMFSVIDAMMNPKIGARQVDQLHTVSLFGTAARRLDAADRERVIASGGRTYQSYTGTAGSSTSPNIVERAGVVRAVRYNRVRANFFTTMAVEPLEGTLAAPNDEREASRLVVISDKLRAQLFHANEAAVGKTIVIDGAAFTVTGVASRFAGTSLLDTDVWLFPEIGKPILPNLVRLRDGMSLKDARQEFALLAGRLGAMAGDTVHTTRFDLRPIAQQFRIQSFDYALVGAALAVLLVACSNLANLQLARGIGRASELAVRTALGASRPQIVGQLIIESTVLAFAALVLAILLAISGNAIVRATIPPNVGAYVVAPLSSWHMVAFASMAAVLSVVLVGLVPAIRVSRIDVNSLIKSRAGTGAHRSNRRVYGALVIAQLTLTFPLVCAAVLLARGVQRVTDVDFLVHEGLGFDPRPLVMAQLYWQAGEEGSSALMSDIAGELTSIAHSIPNVADASVSFRGKSTTGMMSMDDPEGGIRDIPVGALNYQIVSPSHFRTMGMPIQQGRDFQDGGHAESRIAIDPNTAMFLWPRTTAIGRAIKYGSRKSSLPWMKVDAIIGDVLSDEARIRKRGIDTLRVNTIIRTMTIADSLPIAKQAAYVLLTVRANGDPQPIASALRRLLHNRTRTPPHVELAVDYLGIPDRTAQLRFIAGLFATLGLLALGLTALGVYGIVAQSAADRQREVAVRMSLGASPRKIVYTLLREGNVLVLAGVAAGLYLTKETIGWLGTFLGEVDTSSALFYGTLCVIVFMVIVITALVPAIRATRVDPMQVLRSE